MITGEKVTEQLKLTDDQECEANTPVFSQQDPFSSQGSAPRDIDLTCDETLQMEDDVLAEELKQIGDRLLASRAFFQQAESKMATQLKHSAA